MSERTSVHPEWLLDYARKHCHWLGATDAPARHICCDCMGFIGSTLCHVPGHPAQTDPSVTGGLDANSPGAVPANDPSQASS